VSIEMIKWFLCLLFLMFCITFNDFSYVVSSLNPWDESKFVVVYDIPDMPLNLVCQYFTEEFCTCVH
jgi:hypothetical protein